MAKKKEPKKSPSTPPDGVVESVAKKKGLSSFGSMLKAASAKRKERNLKFKNNGENES